MCIKNHRHGFINAGRCYQQKIEITPNREKPSYLAFASLLITQKGEIEDHTARFLRR
jgi:hypothetical protein